MLLTLYQSAKPLEATKSPPEAIKYGKPALLESLHELLCLCWEEGGVPQDMRDATIDPFHCCCLHSMRVHIERQKAITAPLIL